MAAKELVESALRTLWGVSEGDSYVERSPFLIRFGYVILSGRSSSEVGNANPFQISGPLGRLALAELRLTMVLDVVVAQVVASPLKRLKIAATHLKAEDATMGDEYLQQIVEIVI